MADEEKAVGDGCKQETPRLGYPAAAAFISRDPDHETYVFRSFNSLTARNLLQLQGELITLERLLAAMDDEAAKDPCGRIQLSLRSRGYCQLTINTSNSSEMVRKRQALEEIIEAKL